MIVQTFSGEVEVASNLSVNTNTLHVNTQTSNVGIGKINPSYNLDVNGTLNASSLYINGSKLELNDWSSSGSDIYYTNGNVGFGTNEFLHELNVDSEFRISNISNASTFSDLSGEGMYQQLLLTLPNGGTQDGRIGMTPSSNTIVAGNGSSVYIYDVDTVNDSLTLNQSFSNVDSGHGYHASVSGDGSRVLTTSLSKVYVYEKSGGAWSLQSSFSRNGAASLISLTDQAISRDGNHIALSINPLASGIGTANIFTWSGTSWGSQFSITPTDGGTYDSFGKSMAFSEDGTYFIAGSPRHDLSGSSASGTAYIYVKTGSGSTWDLQQKLTRPSETINANDLAGESVDISSDGSVCVLGAPNKTVNSGSNGSVFIYTRSGSTWTYQTQILHPDGGGDENTEYYFGESVSITPKGDKILVAAPVKSSNNNGNPSSFVFEYDGSSWNLIGEELDSGTNPADYIRTYITQKYALLSDTLFGSEQILKIDSSLEVNGNLTSFTGQHICHTKIDFEPGLIVSANKNKYVNLNGPVVTGKRAIISDESLPIVSLSNTVNDKNVFGVACYMEESGTLTRKQENGGIIVNSHKELGDDRVVVNSLGEGAVWVVNTNGSLSSGDYITSSNVPGYGQKQDDDVLHNYTVAKITMDCDFNPLEQPAQIIKKDENGVNILNNEDLLQWEDHPTETEKAYQIKYLTSEGIQTDQANAVYIAAFVGCTYHCG